MTEVSYKMSSVLITCSPSVNSAESPSNCRQHTLQTRSRSILLLLGSAYVEQSSCATRRVSMTLEWLNLPRVSDVPSVRVMQKDLILVSDQRPQQRTAALQKRQPVLA